jgi:hypothetical protein
MIPFNQAAQASPVLAQITERIRQSQHMRAVIDPVLPPGLRPHVSAGPLDNGTWCVLVGNPAVGSKVRQLTPTLLQALQQAGLDVQRLRLKVRTP